MTGRQDVFQQAMNQGHSAAWDQLWDRAAEFYRRALREFPDHSKALTSLGLALVELGDFNEALSCYHHAARVLPDDPLLVEKVAQICERLGRLNDAITAYLRAADLFAKKNDLERAVDNWSSVLRFNPENLQAYTRLAVTYERLGRRSEAVSAYLAIASLVQHSGDVTKAIQAVNRALQLLPDHNEAQAALAQIRSNQMLTKPARPRGGTGPMMLARVNELGKSPADTTLAAGAAGEEPVAEARQRALVHLAEILFEQADERDADEPAARSDMGSLISGKGGPSTAGVDRTRIALHLGQAIDHQTQSQNKQATEELERAVEVGLNHPAAFFNLGYLHAEAGQLDQAISDLRLSEKSPDYAMASHLLLGSVLRKAERLNEAAVEYLEALKLADATTVSEFHANDLRQLYEPLIDNLRRETNQETLATLCENIRVQLQSENWRDYLQRAREQLPLQPDGSPPLPLAEMLLTASSSKVIESIALVRSLAARGLVQTAVEEAYQAIQYAPTYLPLHVQIGELLLQDGRIQDAIDKFATVSQVYQVRGDMNQASDLLRRVSHLAPMDLSSRGQLIDMLVSNGQVDEAIREHMELAELYYRQAELDLARKTFMAALRLAQQSSSIRAWSVQLLYKMADIDMQRLDWRQAVRVFEQVRTLAPEDESARASLIDLYFRLGQEATALSELDSYLTFLDSSAQRDQAIKFLAGLVEEQPEQIELRRRLADQLRRAGRKAEAITELEKIGDQMLNAGNRAGAAALIQYIIAMNPSNVDEYRQLLAQLQ